jgi:hypothetical protein
VLEARLQKSNPLGYRFLRMVTYLSIWVRSVVQNYPILSKTPLFGKTGGIK